MKLRILLIIISYITFVILIITPPLVHTQDTIGSTYIGIKDIAKIYSSQPIDYSYQKNEIVITNYENRIAINEDGYLGIKNGKEIFYLPSKLYHKDSIIYAPIELINTIEKDNIEEDIDDNFEWIIDYEVDINESFSNFKYIIIDPGHGGKDPGAVNGEVYEKDIVLKIAFKLKYELLKRNPSLIIIMTRTKDVDLASEKSRDLRKRAEVGSKSAINGSGLLISIHANAMPPKVNHDNAKGIETWYYNPSSKNLSQEVLDYRRKWIDNVYKIVPETREPEKEKIVEQINKSIQKHNKLLAMSIQNNLYNKLKNYTEDRGIKKAAFQVLRESVIPSVLCEVGFITNSSEKKLLLNSSYQQKIAEGIADGIVRYISLNKPILSN